MLLLTNVSEDMRGGKTTVTSTVDPMQFNVVKHIKIL